MMHFSPSCRVPSMKNQEYIARRTRWLIGCLGVILCGFLAGGISDNEAFSQEGSNHYLLSPAAKKFPLWSALPVSSFAVLDEGVLKERRWGVYAFRGKRTNRGASTCIQIVSLRELGSGLSIFGGDSICGALAPSNDVPILDRVVYDTVKSSTLAIAVDPTVTQVAFDLNQGPDLVRRTKLLSSMQASKAHVRQFRYVVFSLASSVCIESVLGFSAVGEQVFETSRRACHHARQYGL